MLLQQNLKVYWKLKYLTSLTRAAVYNGWQYEYTCTGAAYNTSKFLTPRGTDGLE